MLIAISCKDINYFTGSNLLMQKLLCSRTIVCAEAFGERRDAHSVLREWASRCKFAVWRDMVFIGRRFLVAVSCRGCPYMAVVRICICVKVNGLWDAIRGCRTVISWMLRFPVSVSSGCDSIASRLAHGVSWSPVRACKFRSVDSREWIGCFLS